MRVNQTPPRKELLLRPRSQPLHQSHATGRSRAFLYAGRVARIGEGSQHLRQIRPMALRKVREILHHPAYLPLRNHREGRWTAVGSEVDARDLNIPRNERWCRVVVNGAHGGSLRALPLNALDKSARIACWTPTGSRRNRDTQRVRFRLMVCRSRNVSPRNRVSCRTAGSKFSHTVSSRLPVCEVPVNTCFPQLPRISSYVVLS